MSPAERLNRAARRPALVSTKHKRATLCQARPARSSGQMAPPPSGSVRGAPSSSCLELKWPLSASLLVTMGAG